MTEVQKIDLMESLTRSLWPYRWYWRKRLGERKGEPCRVLARGSMNSILVEFRDGFQVVTSRYAVRKRKAVSSTR